jgi:hypothetical protein
LPAIHSWLDKVIRACCRLLITTRICV